MILRNTIYSSFIVAALTAGVFSNSPLSAMEDDLDGSTNILKQYPNFLLSESATPLDFQGRLSDIGSFSKSKNPPLLKQTLLDPRSSIVHAPVGPEMLNELDDLFPGLNRGNISQENVERTQDQLNLSAILEMADDRETIPYVSDESEGVNRNFCLTNEVKSSGASSAEGSEESSSIRKSKQPKTYVSKKRANPRYERFKELYEQYKKTKNHVAIIINEMEISERDYRNFRDRYKRYRDRLNQD